MALTGPIPGIDLVGDAIAAIISLLITYYAHKAYRLSGERSLFLLYLGFLLVGVGFISQTTALLLGAFIPANSEIIPSNLTEFEHILLVSVRVGSVIHWILQVLGYLTIFVAYLYQSRNVSLNNLPPIGMIALQIIPISIARIIFRPELELIIFLLLIFILIQVIVIYVPQHHLSTLLVILGFLLLSLAHLAFLLFVFFARTSIYIYAFGHIVQLAGFLLLLAMLLRTTRGK